MNIIGVTVNAAFIKKDKFDNKLARISECLDIRSRLLYLKCYRLPIYVNNQLIIDMCQRKILNSSMKITSINLALETFNLKKTSRENQTSQ